MTRRKQTDNSTAVSLFPFMAVLLCTMGALMLILLVLARQARKIAEQPVVPADDALVVHDKATFKKYNKKKLKRDIAELKKSRDRADEVMTEERRRLRHIEKQIWELSEKLLVAEGAAERLKQTEDNKHNDRRLAEEEVARLKKMVEESRKEYEKGMADARKRPPSYSIVPFQGPNKTNRRPLYIECLEDKVVLQPEGVELLPADFEAPLGPDNPLASAIRAASEYLVLQEQSQVSAQATHQELRKIEPYPLLIVRPKGVVSYYKARAALESFGEDFGYELVGQDWNLEFPPANPQVAIAQNRAVKQGRAIRAHMAKIAPSRFRMTQAGPSSTYRVGRRGGLAPENASQFEPAHEGFGGGSFASRRAKINSQRNGEGVGTQETGGVYQQKVGRVAASPRGNQPQQAGQVSKEQSRPEKSQTAERNQNGDSAEKIASQGSPPSDGQRGKGKSKSIGLRSDSDTPAENDANIAGGTGGAGHSPFGNPNGTPGDGSGKGKNWALPDAKRGLIPIRRPLHIVCRGDRLAILPNGPNSAAAMRATKISDSKNVIPLPGSTASGLDAFVEQVQNQMISWGIAGSGMYWRPSLVLHVSPDGRGRAEDLKVLLKDSGLDIKENRPHSARSARAQAPGGRNANSLGPKPQASGPQTSAPHSPSPRTANRPLFSPPGSNPIVTGRPNVRPNPWGGATR